MSNQPMSFTEAQNLANTYFENQRRIAAGIPTPAPTLLTPAPPPPSTGFSFSEFAPMLSKGLADRAAGAALMVGAPETAAALSQYGVEALRNLDPDTMARIQAVMDAPDFSQLTGSPITKFLEGAGQITGAFASDPYAGGQVLLGVLGASLPEFIASGALAATGAGAGPGGALAAGRTVAVLSALEGALAGQAEYGGALLDAVRERLGTETPSAPEIAALLKDEQFLAEVNEKGIPRSLAVGGLTSLLGPLTSVAARAPSRLGRISGVAGAQALQEGIPETGAQLASEGAIVDPEAIALETFVGGLIGLPTGIVSVLGNRAGVEPPPDPQDTAIEEVSTQLQLTDQRTPPPLQLTDQRTPAERETPQLTQQDSTLEPADPSFDIQTGRLQSRITDLTRRQNELNKQLQQKSQSELLRLARASQTPSTISYDQLSALDQLRVARTAQQRNIPTPERLGVGDLQTYNLNPDYLKQASPTSDPDLDALYNTQSEIQQEKATLLAELNRMRTNTKRYGPTFRQLLDNTNLRVAPDATPIRSPEQLVSAYDRARTRMAEIQQNPTPTSADEFRALNRFTQDAEPVLASEAFAELSANPPIIEEPTPPPQPNNELSAVEAELTALDQNLKNLSGLLNSSDPDARAQLAATARAQGTTVPQLRKQLNAARTATEQQRNELRTTRNNLRRAAKTSTPSQPAPASPTPTTPTTPAPSTPSRVTPAKQTTRTSLSPGNPEVRIQNPSQYAKQAAAVEEANQTLIQQRRDGTIPERGFFKSMPWLTSLVSVNNLGHVYERMATLINLNLDKRKFATSTIEQAFAFMPNAQNYLKSASKAKEFNETIGRVAEYARLNRLTLRNTEGNISVPELNITLTAEQTQAYKELQAAMQHAMKRFTDGLLTGINPAFVNTPIDTLIARHPQHRSELERVKQLLDLSQNGPDYIPFNRPGNYTVYAAKPNGEIHYETFKTLKEAKEEYPELQRKLTADGYTEISPIQEKTQSTKLYKDLANRGRLSIIETMDALLSPKYTDLEERRNNVEKIFSELGKRKRADFIDNLMKSENIPGYDTNFAQSIRTYIEKMGSAGAAFAYQPRMKAAVSDVNLEHPELTKIADSFVINNADVHEAIKWMHQFAFLNIFGLDIGAAALQFFGLPINVIPQLQIFGLSPIKDSAEVSKLSAQAMGTLYSLKATALRGNRIGGIDFRSEESLQALSKFLSPDEITLVRNAAEEVSSSTLIQTLFGNTDDLAPDLSSDLRRRASFVIEKSGVWMRDAEQIMRLATTIQAYRKAKAVTPAKLNDLYGNNGFYQDFLAQGFSPAEAAARTFNRSWNPLFGRGEEPAIMSAYNGIPGVLFKYQNYPQQIIEGMVRSAVQMGPAGQMALAFQLLAIGLSAGIYGLPFAEDIIETAEAAYKQITGTEPLIEERLTDWAQQQVEDFPMSVYLLGEDGRGLTRGFGRDFLGTYVSERIGLGTTPATQGIREVALGETPAQELGLFSIANNIGKDINAALVKDDPLGVVLALAPGFIKDIHKAYIVYPEIGAVSRNGEKVYLGPPGSGPEAITSNDQFARFIGFQPADVQRAMQTQFTLSTMKNFATEYNSRVRNSFQLAVRDEFFARARNDAEGVRAAVERQREIMQETAAFNRKAQAPWQMINPDWSRLRREGAFLAIPGPDLSKLPRDLRAEALRRGLPE